MDHTISISCNPDEDERESTANLPIALPKVMYIPKNLPDTASGTMSAYYNRKALDLFG